METASDDKLRLAAAPKNSVVHVVLDRADFEPLRADEPPA